MKKPNHKPLPDATYARTPPPHMQRARVVRYDERRGSGEAVLTNAGRKIRLPWSALRGANVTALSVGDEIFVEVDYHDRGRAEAIFVP